MKDNKSNTAKEELIKIVIHEFKAILVFREEDEELGFVPVSTPPLYVEKEFSFTVTKEEIGEGDILSTLIKNSEESILSTLAKTNMQMFDLSIPKVVYFDCTINGERKVFDEWPKMKPTEDEKD